MISVLTGDIINSKGINPEEWMSSLKKVLSNYAAETSGWEIYRGDSFQIEVQPSKALELAIQIKLAIKKHKEIDVRIAIGIGDKSYKSSKITESNGTAFVNSGECFETIKKTTLAIKTTSSDFDYTMNTMFQLALLIIDNWTVNSVKLIKTIFEHTAINQKELALLLSKSQSTISEGLKRSGYYEINKMMKFYEYKINNTVW